MMLHDPLHYHREIEGTEILSRTFESNEVLTPLQIPSCPTVSQDRYEELRESLRYCKLPGGTEREHGGIALPVSSEDRTAMDKALYTLVRGHLHLGSDVNPWPRGLLIEQYYDITPLKKSDVRMNDDLLHKPPSSLAKPLYLPFPTSHPYQTYISRYAMFPNFRSPEDRDTGIDASSQQPFHPNIPSKAFDMVVLKTTKGNPYRHEVVSIPFDSMKKALHWPGQHGYLQFPKSAEEKDQIFYPKPPKTVAPNATFKELEHNLSPRTTNMLRNTERAQWIPTYSREFTGRGPMNPLNLDDYHMKAVGRLTGELGTDVELEETFLPTLSQTRPLEGRTARLLQGQRPRECILQEQHRYQERAKLSRIHNQKNHYPDTKLPINEFRRIADRWQKEAFDKAQLSGRPELQIPPKSAHSLSYDDFNPKHLYQHTIWENPLRPSQSVLPQDVNSEESKIALHELCYQEASQPAWRPGDGPRETAQPEWLPGSEVPRRHTVLLELQHSFSKTAAQKRFHASINGETKDLRDNISEGRRHKFYGFNAFYFHN